MAEELSPVHIADDALNKLTVKQLKHELTSRGVPHQSKMRKYELLVLLEASLDLPVLSIEEQARREKKAEADEKKRKAEEKKKKAEKVDEMLEWNESHPARKLLYDELVSGMIPVDAEQMGPAEVYYMCYQSFEFQMSGMMHGDTFTRRLRDLRKQVKRDRRRADSDRNALAVALANYPPSEHNHRGEPQWNGSLAQALLKLDMEQGKHLRMKPQELRATREEYQAFGKDNFRWKVRQMVKTKKCLHTLEHNANEKLRANVARLIKAAEEQHYKGDDDDDADE